MVVSLARSWWALVLRGLVALGLGLFAWIRPDLFWASLVLVFAVYAVVDGVFALVAAVKGEGGDRWTHLLEGILGIGAGVLVFLFPDQAGTAIVLVIGIRAVMTGALEVISAFRLRKEIADEWLLALCGVLSIVLGLILLAQPNFGQVGTTYVLGTNGIVFGVLLVLLGFRLRGFKAALPAQG